MRQIDDLIEYVIQLDNGMSPTEKQVIISRLDAFPSQEEIIAAKSILNNNNYQPTIRNQNAR